MPRLSPWISCSLALLAIGGCRQPTERPGSDPATLRATRSGALIGFAGAYGSHTWLGIPYARPPVDGLRWRAPRAPEPWGETRTALSPGSPCVQIANTFGGIEENTGEVVGSEDCLYLNVWAPPLAPAAVPKAGSKALPVMVWIHGGGNTIGHGGFYNGGNLAVSEQVIVVTFNYRLGPFGWFRHPALAGDDTSPEDRSGNYGTLDIIRALAWVHDNIGAFGGDINRVTIFGESAGGTNVFTMLVSPMASGRFHRAIAQSGGPWTDSIELGENFSDDPTPGHRYSSNEVLAKLLIEDGKADDRAAAKLAIAHMTPIQIRTYLRSKSGEQIIDVYDSQFAPGMFEMPKVFRDGTVLPREPIMERLARRDGYNQVPVMLGTNRDENKLFMFGDPTLVRKALLLFPRVRDPRWYNLTAAYLANMWKATGVDQPAAALSASQGGGSIFGYRFDWDEEPTILGTDLAELLGAAHAFEIPFVFGHFDLGREANQIFTEANQPGRALLSRQMMSYWAAFAKDGVPGVGGSAGLTEWPSWTTDGGGPQYLVFDTPAGGGLRLETETYSKASLIAAIDSDPRLADQRERCMIYRELTLRSRALTPPEYVTAGSHGCADYPLETYPWS